MKLAVFNSNSKIPGAILLFENDSFIIENMGTIDIEKVFALDNGEALTWEPGVQEKIYGFYNKELPGTGVFPDDMLSQPAPLSSKIQKTKFNQKKIIIGVAIGVLIVLLSGTAIWAYANLGHKSPKPNNTIQNIVPIQPETPVTTPTVPATSSVVPTPTIEPTTTVVPTPLEYNFSNKKAADIVKKYYKALAKKDYNSAYLLTVIADTDDTTVSVNATDTISSLLPEISKTDWTKTNKNADYMAIIATDTVPVSEKEIKKAPYKLTSEGREITLKNLKNVTITSKVSSEIDDELVVGWNKRTDGYYIIDNNAIIKSIKYNKDFTKTVDGTTANIHVGQIYMTYKYVYVPWSYIDNGSKNNVSITMNSQTTKMSVKQPSKDDLSVTTKWIGTDSWTMPQNLLNNNFMIKTDGIFTPSTKFDLTLKLQMLRKQKTVAPDILIKF